MECPIRGISPKLTLIISCHESGPRTSIIGKIAVHGVRIGNGREGSEEWLMAVVAVNASSTEGERAIFWRSDFVGRCSIRNKKFFPHDKFFCAKISTKNLPNQVRENGSSETCRKNTKSKRCQQ